MVCLRTNESLYFSVFIITEMNKLTPFILLITASVMAVLQSDAQEVKTKDGITLGDRSTLVRDCAVAAGNETVEMQGVEVDYSTMCACLIEEMIPLVTMQEFSTAAENDAVTELMMRDDIFPVVMDCVMSNLEDIGETQVLDEGEQADGMHEMFLFSCMKGMTEPDEDGFSVTEEQARTYCQCALDKVREKGLSVNQILTAEDEDSEVFNELVLPCVMDMLADEEPESLLEESADYEVPETYITGAKAREIEVPLQDAFGQYKIKLVIGGVVRYYLLDTGASDLIISRDLERELLLNGTLTPESYIGTEGYELADGSLVTADVVILPEIEIGGYILHDAIAAVLPEGGMLCGMGLLNQFSDWSINRDRDVLRLKR